MKIFFQWFVSAVAIGVAAYIVPGVTVTIAGALTAAVVLGALNFFIRPILMVLTLPINILTLGLFSLVINACLVLLATYLVPGFNIPGNEPFYGPFVGAMLFALVLSIVNWVFNVWSRP